MHVAALLYTFIAKYHTQFVHSILHRISLLGQRIFFVIYFAPLLIFPQSDKLLPVILSFKQSTCALCYCLPHTYAHTQTQPFLFIKHFFVLCAGWAFDITTLNIQLRLFGGIIVCCAGKLSYMRIDITFVEPNILTKQRTKLKNFKFVEK